MCFLVLVVSFCSNIHVYGFMYLLDVLISISLCTTFSNFCFQSYLFHLHTFVFASVHSPLFFSNFFMVLFGLSLFHFYMSVLFLVFSFYSLIYCQFNIAIFISTGNHFGTTSVVVVGFLLETVCPVKVGSIFLFK